MKKVKCRHCQKPKHPYSLLNGDYCEMCVENHAVMIIRAVRASHLVGARKCLIPGCQNHTDEGKFIGDLCFPCHDYVFKNKGVDSQAYRNEITKSNLRMASKIKSMPRDQAWALLISRLLSSKDMARLRKDLCRG